MTDPQEVEVTLMLCDWAEAINGKLFIQGGGWTRIAPHAPNAPLNFALAMIVRVPYTRTNQKLSIDLTLLTEDGAPYAPPAPGGNSGPPVQFTMTFEVGRPPGMKAGEGTNLPFAAKLNGLNLTPGGYKLQASMDGDELASLSFTAMERK